MMRSALFLGLLLLVPAQQPATVNRLAWLAGCWEQRSARGTIEEQWMTPRGRSMLGVSRTIRGDTLATHEFLMIREHGGTVAYHANPAGQAPAVFPAIRLDDTSVVFEDPQHDFPQRIGYTRRADSLLAWIEGTRNGQTRRIPYPYGRTACTS
jgi:uncharacterized protein DUF6265